MVQYLPTASIYRGKIGEISRYCGKNNCTISRSNRNIHRKFRGQNVDFAVKFAAEPHNSVLISRKKCKFRCKFRGNYFYLSVIQKSI